ncbi:MAG: hypothetical protein WCL04_05355 [Verrucomicrobiota bacterium]
MNLNRREFLTQTGAATAAYVAAGVLPARAATTNLPAAGAGRGVAIIRDPADAVASAKPVQWATEQLRLALAARGFDVRLVARPDEARPDDFCVVASGGVAAATLVSDFRVALPDAAEALAIAPGRLGTREALLAQGRDARGLSYALTEIADNVTLSDNPLAALRPAQAVAERPANAIRSVIRLVVSETEDKGWFNDRAFWTSYLSMLAAHRFNRLNLSFGLGYDGGYEGGLGLREGYLHFTYPFLVKVPGYDVRATNLTDAERDANLAMLRFITDEAAARGLDFFMGLWTHSFEWPNSPNANHLITGLTAQTQAPYCRDALALILKACPNITGVTFRIHGESGVPEGNYDLWKIIFSGLTLSGRRPILDLHAKGIDQPTIDAAMSTGLPVSIAPKFSAEHMGLPYHQAAIRQKEMPTGRPGTSQYAVSEGARSFTRYGYADLIAAGRKYGLYHRIWPGTQRLLMWGDPVFAAAYARAGSFGGTEGVEIFDPLSFKGRKGSGLPGGRDGYADTTLRAPGGDHEKFRYGYRLWGRMFYNPDTKPDVWQRQLRADYGNGISSIVERSLGAASRILPLVTNAHLVSASNNMYWPELYVNMSIVNVSGPAPFSDSADPKRFGGVSPLDPQLFYRVDDYADDLLKGTASVKYSPVEVAQWLEDLEESARVMGSVFGSPIGDQARNIQRCQADVLALGGLGRFFAQKFRAGVLYRLFERTGDRAALDAAVQSYKAARAAWAQIADATKGAYVADLSWGDAWYQHGHWSDRIARIDEDIAAMLAKTAPTTAANPTPEKTAALIKLVQTGAPTRPAPGVTHTPPASFRPGLPVVLTLTPAAGQPVPKEATLHYRHANQAELWQSAPTARDGSGFRATIPAEYANSPYHLTYYFELNHGADVPALFPGLTANLANQPYYLLLRAT